MICFSFSDLFVISTQTSTSDPEHLHTGSGDLLKFGKTFIALCDPTFPNSSSFGDLLALPWKGLKNLRSRKYPGSIHRSAEIVEGQDRILRRSYGEATPTVTDAARSCYNLHVSLPGRACVHVRYFISYDGKVSPHRSRFLVETVRDQFSIWISAKISAVKKVNMLPSHQASHGVPGLVENGQDSKKDD